MTRQMAGRTTSAIEHRSMPPLESSLPMTLFQTRLPMEGWSMLFALCQSRGSCDNPLVVVCSLEHQESALTRIG